MGQYAMLFRPVEIGSLELRNRVVMAPMTSGYGSPDGYATQDLADYYVARARGGVGLITCEACYVERVGRGFLGQLALDHDRYIPDLAKLSRSVHEAGAKIVLQLIHCGRQATSAMCGGQPVAPSAIPCPVIREMPRALSLKEVRGLIDAFVTAALRSKEAGFDGVELHAAHGYLLNQFLSPYSNTRTDEYGGDLFNRCRVLLEILEGIRSQLGSNYPILCRLSADEFVPRGLTLSDTRILAKWLQNAGLNAISVSGGVYETAHRIVPPMDVQQGSLVSLAQGIRESVSIPVIAVGGFHDPFFADRVLVEGKADLIAMGRALLADPEWANKAQRKEIHLIRPCIYCNQCRNRILRPRINCTVNYETGREGTTSLKQRSATVRKVLVAGGGIAGIAAACIARDRGHQVVLCEKGHELGGNLSLASVPPGRERLRHLLDFLKAETVRKGVEVIFNAEVNEGLIKRQKAEVVLLATGSRPLVPKIPGIHLPHVFLATDLLRKEIETGAHVLIIGGGLVGLETADHLRAKGKAVTLVEKLPAVAVAPQVEAIFKRCLLDRLSGPSEPVLILTSTEVLEIAVDHVKVQQTTGEKILPGIDSVVVAGGFEPFIPIRPEEILALGCEVHVIGDAIKPQTLFEAAHSAAQVAYSI